MCARRIVFSLCVLLEGSVESLASTANTFDVTLAERCNGFRLTAREQLPFILPITYFCDLTSGEAMFAGLIN